MTNQKKADAALVMVTVFWGASYVMSDYALNFLHPFTLCAIRFLIAFALAYPVFYRKMRPVSRHTLRYAFLIGSLLTGVYAFTNFGILHTSLTNVGFIVALPVIFTPLINFFFRKIRPARKMILVLILATTGMAMMTLNERFVPALGDLLCLVAALCYAGDIVVTEIAVQSGRVNALQLGVFVLGTVAGLMTLLSLFFGERAEVIDSDVWLVVFLLAVFSTGFAFIAQSVAQQYTSSTHVGLIFTLEPVFAAGAAYWIVGEILQPRAYFGAVLMLIAVLWAEIDLTGWVQRRKHRMTPEASPETERDEAG
ncbi:MAG TPA: DMT family transporter [Anaerovoracaceae bacterium]|nr:DMT family transporter [Anaerovoracaceae bacterium]